MCKRIVVGHDGTAEGRDAIALGGAIARATGAPISLIHVFSPMLIPIAGMTDRRTLRRLAEQGLRAERRRFAPDATVHTITDSSTPRGIRHHAERWQADLVVIGSARHTEVGHTRAGRHGRQLFWDAPFPVAVARRGLADEGCELRSITVGYEGGPESERALRCAVDLATSSGAKLKLLSVIEHHPHALGPLIGPLHHDPKAALEEQRQLWLERAQARVYELGIEATTEVVIGDPGHRLQEASHDTDLMVIGSRRWGTLARIVSGSVGETLTGNAGCSIVVVPRPARARKHTATLKRSAAAS